MITNLMGEEQKILRFLELAHGVRGRGEAPPCPLIRTMDHDVYSCEPDQHLPLPSGVDQNQKLFYCTDVTRRVTSARGPTRQTPEGGWKSTDRLREVNIHGATLYNQHFKYMRQGQNMKWAMIEYTLYPPHSKENRYALCYVYRTKQDRRQTNGSTKKKKPNHDETNEGTSPSFSIQEDLGLTQEDIDWIINNIKI